jgi:hypothetical protein
VDHERGDTAAHHGDTATLKKICRTSKRRNSAALITRCTTREIDRSRFRITTLGVVVTYCHYTLRIASKFVVDSEFRFDYRFKHISNVIAAHINLP